MVNRVEKNEKKVEWYNEPSMVTSILIGLIVVIILLSQSFAIKNELSAMSILSSILSHNSVYLLVCVYFIFLKTKLGKKYFNYLNIFLILIYLLTSFTSLLTVFQSFNLVSIISLCIQLFIVLYLVHTFFRGTRIWNDFKLNKSPFNEFTNEGYFYTIVILAVILLAVNLIMTTSFDGTVLALLDCSFNVLFARYIYLYWNFLDYKKIDIKNSGNFDKVVDKVEDAFEKLLDEEELHYALSVINDLQSFLAVEAKVDFTLLIKQAIRGIPESVKKLKEICEKYSVVGEQVEIILSSGYSVEELFVCP